MRKSVWLNRDYLILWVGQTVSSLGSNISSIAYPLLILFLTNSPAKAGLGAALSTLPTLLFALPAGVIVDRLNRKKLMIFCDIGRTLLMASIPLAAMAGYLSVYQIYVVAFLEGTFSLLFTLSGIAAISQIVGKDQVTDALSKNNIGDGVASITGPSIGGVVFQTLGKTAPFLFDSISYVFSVISLFFIRKDFQVEIIRENKKLHLEIVEGLSWLWTHKLVRFLAFLTAGGAIFGAGQTLLIILIAKRIGSGEAAIGLIFSIASVGALLGSVSANRIQKMLGIRKVILFIRWFQLIAWPLYFFVNNVALLSTITGIFYFLSAIYGIVVVGFRLSLIPNNLQGRVTSVYRMIVLGSATVGSLLVGLLSQSIGINSTLLVEFGIIVLLAIIATTNKDFQASENLERR